jgi:hypothetical protein
MRTSCGCHVRISRGVSGKGGGVDTSNNAELAHLRVPNLKARFNDLIAAAVSCCGGHDFAAFDALAVQKLEVLRRDDDFVAYGGLVHDRVAPYVEEVDAGVVAEEVGDF